MGMPPTRYVLDCHCSKVSVSRSLADFVMGAILGGAGENRGKFVGNLQRVHVYTLPF